MKALRDLRVGVAFPWAGIVEREHGSAQRIGLLVDLLQEHVGRVSVLAPGHGPDETRQRRRLRLPSANRRRVGARAARARSVSRYLLESVARTPLGADEDLWLWRHLECRFRPSLARSLATLVRSSDVVLVSFPSGPGPSADSAVGTASRSSRPPTIASRARCVRAAGCAGSRAEPRSVRCAGPIAVSSAARRTARPSRATACKPRVLLSGVDLRRGAAPIDVAIRARLREQLDLAESNQVCLFIGAVHGPNYAAATAVRAMARTVAARGRRDVRFVIAGNVMAPEHDGNLTALGRVDGSPSSTSCTAWRISSSCR